MSSRANILRIQNIKTNKSLSFFEFLLIASSVACLIYSVFYFLSPTIWSMNIKLPLEAYSPWVRWCVEPRDGIEAYVIYIMTFVTILTTLILSKLYSSIKHKFIFILPLAIASFFYFKSIGFNMPMSSVSVLNVGTLELFASIILILVFMITIEKYLPYILWFVIPVLLLPFCFIPIQLISWEDASYIFDPALKLLHGIVPSQIYFQYDLLLSLFAVFWMKLKIDPHLFQVFGQLSFYLLFIGIFFFSKAFFYSKRLSIYLLISLVIFRIYANLNDPTFLLQVTPLRLDLWFILVFLVYSKGFYHWSVAFALGLLAILHRSFGIIYFLSYWQLIIILAGFDFYDEFKKEGKNKFHILRWLNRQLKLSVKNLFIFIVVFLSINFLFKINSSQSGVDIYQRLGLGFLPIVKASFYWYIPVLFSILALFLLQYRIIIKERYFHTGMFILLLAIGQSIYFLGRSHENNIINISSLLLLCLFTVVDLLAYNFKDNKTGVYKSIAKLLPTVLSVIFILGTAYCYQENIIARTKMQYQNLVGLRFINTESSLVPLKFSVIKNVTHDSKRVYFMTNDDFLYYYYGDYLPVGFYNPYHAWVLKKEAVNFLQNLLDKNYYLVARQDDWTAPEMLKGLRFKHLQEADGYAFIWNES
jgi:hypothetical protein